MTKVILFLLHHLHHLPLLLHPHQILLNYRVNFVVQIVHADVSKEVLVYVTGILFR
jgi:hypothetical protein